MMADSSSPPRLPSGALRVRRSAFSLGSGLADLNQQTQPTSSSSSSSSSSSPPEDPLQQFRLEYARATRSLDKHNHATQLVQQCIKLRALAREFEWEPIDARIHARLDAIQARLDVMHHHTPTHENNCTRP